MRKAAQILARSPQMNRTDKSPRKVVVVDDDSGFVTVLCKRLETGRLAAPRAASRCRRVDELAAMRPAAIVVNPTLLGASYWEILQTLGESLGSVGLVVCSEQSSVAQRVRGLRMGVDDWIGKPCHPEEVVARVEAVTRRHRRVEADAVDESRTADHG